MRTKILINIIVFLTIFCSHTVQTHDLGIIGQPEVAVLQQRLIDAGCYHGVRDGIKTPTLEIAANSCPDQHPILRIETGMHTASIWQIGVDAKCKLAATGSQDKTVRLWSMPDGHLIRTQRLPIGPGMLGEVNAVAVSPDGMLVAAGGADAAYLIDHKTSVYLFDAATGLSVRRLGAFGNVINRIAFSPDGKRIAIALAGHRGVRMLDVASGREIMSDNEFEDDSYGITFGPDGSLYATAFDRFVRRYGLDGLLTQRIATSGGQRPYNVAADPTGRRVAVSFEDTHVVEMFDAKNLKHLGFADTRNVKNGNLASIDWSMTGTRLFAGGGASEISKGSDRTIIRVFDLIGHKLGSDIPVTDSALTTIKQCGDAIAIATADPIFSLLNANGTITSLGIGHTVDMREKLGENFEVSQDGAQVRLGLVTGGENPALIDILAGQITDAHNPVFGLISADTASLHLTNWENNIKPQLESEDIILHNNDTSRSLAIRPDHGGFVLGSDFYLSSFDAAGKLRWAVPVPSIAWGVNMAQRGELIVVADGDGTIRWHRWSDGKELLAIYINRDDKRFVAWTPAGYYMASPGAEDLIGWHINRGWEQPAEFFPASRFRQKFNRPDVVRLVLKMRDEDIALQKANAIADVQSDETPIIDQLPPVINILSPTEGSKWAPGTVTVNYKARSPSGFTITRVDAFVDGARIEVRGFQRLQGTTGNISLPMPAHDAVISLVAYAGDRASDPVRLALRTSEARSIDDSVQKPRLYALVVGVSAYEDADLNLNFAAKDAVGLADVLKAQDGSMYQSVEVKLLTDSAATSVAVKDGLLWLQQKATARDLELFFVAGHGLTDAKGKFWFLTHDADPARVLSTAVSGDDITGVLYDLPGKKLMFLDACHSGAALDQGARAASQSGPDVSAAVNDFSQTEGGVVAYAASTGREFSYERADWGHGAFSKALIEAIGEGRADFLHKGFITTASLDLFLEERVRTLTDGHQHPVMNRPKIVPDFPIAFVKN